MENATLCDMKFFTTSKRGSPCKKSMPYTTRTLPLLIFLTHPYAECAP